MEELFDWIRGIKTVEITGQPNCSEKFRRSEDRCWDEKPMYDWLAQVYDEQKIAQDKVNKLISSNTPDRDQQTLKAMQDSLLAVHGSVDFANAVVSANGDSVKLEQLADQLSKNMRDSGAHLSLWVNKYADTVVVSDGTPGHNVAVTFDGRFNDESYAGIYLKLMARDAVEDMLQVPDPWRFRKQADYL